MASGETNPVSKTLVPKRVTSRSSCKVFRRCATTRAILSRQELDPISMAAKVAARVGIFKLRAYVEIQPRRDLSQQYNTAFRARRVLPRHRPIHLEVKTLSALAGILDF